MKLELNIPEGYEIDLEKSDLAKGQIFTKKIEKVITNWESLGEIRGSVIQVNSQITESKLTGYSTSTMINQNIFPTEADAKTAIAFAKLMQVRKALIGDWVADWKNMKKTKYCVVLDGSLAVCHFYITFEFFSFPTREMAEHFLEHNREDLNVYYQNA